MKSRIDKLPVYETLKVNVRAQDYNLTKIALKRISNPLRFEIPSLRSLDFYIADDIWVIVDRSLNDIPVVAWTDFDDKARSNLHKDIACSQRHYHRHANIILDKALEALQLLIGEKLSAAQADFADVIAPFRLVRSGNS